MTIKDLAEILTQQGHDITLRKRADGGYIISKIDGVSYKGASGNIMARKITGATLSHARSVQLARIRPPKKVAPSQRKLTKLPENLVKKMRKIQREWRKTHKDISGTISMRGLRYQYEKYGEETAAALLDKSFRYAQGYAYIENVNWLIERISRLAMLKDDSSVLQRIVEKISVASIRFKEEWIAPVYQAMYDYQKGGISAEEFERIVNSIIL